MLPMLHVDPGKQNCVLCAGPFAEAFAAYCLHWRDVARVLLLEKPVKLVDKRIELIDHPPVGCCDAVIVSPDTDPMPFTGSLAKHGILCASTGYPDRRTTEFYAKMRAAFRPIKPWREHLPGPLYGVLASPAGAPSRRRDPPGSARRLNTQYIPSLFVFGTDEVPLVFGSSNAKMTPTKPLITLDADVVEPSIKDELCSL